MTQEFDPFDLDAIERAQREADGELDSGQGNDGTAGDQANAGSGNSGEQGQGNANAGGETGAEAGAEGEAGATGADAGDAGQAANVGEQGDKSSKPIGVSSKKGDRVLPYSALQQAREDARAAKQQAEAKDQELAKARAELEALKAGKPLAKADGEDLANLSDEEISEIEADFPQLAKVARMAKLAVEKVGKSAPAAAAERTQEATQQHQESDDPVQDAIDQIPDLLAWQTDKAHADKFQRAIEHDNVLKNSPKWASKSFEERFTEAARRVREEFDLDELAPSQDQAAQQAAAQQRVQAAERAVQNATRSNPNTLSDLNGGARPASDQIASLTPTAMLNRMMTMSRDEIMAQLDRGG